MVGSLRSTTLAVQQITKEKNRALLISSSGSSDLTGEACSPVSVHWTYDTYALAQTAGKAIIEQGRDTWFFITADYAFGHGLERDTTAIAEDKLGGLLPCNTKSIISGELL
jgi:branched-chain amino acid transport system substrate-binding protein